MLWVLFGLEMLFIATLVAGVALQMGVPIGLIVLGVLGVLAIERTTASVRAPARKKGGAK